MLVIYAEPPGPWSTAAKRAWRRAAPAVAPEPAGRRCAAPPRPHRPRLQRCSAPHRRAAAPPPLYAPKSLAPAVILNFGAPRGAWQPCRRPQAATANTRGGVAGERCHAALHHPHPSRVRYVRTCANVVARRGARHGAAPPRNRRCSALRWPPPPKVRAQPRAAVPRRRAAPRAAPAPGTYTGYGGAIRMARRWWCAPAAARAPPHFFRQCKRRDKRGDPGR